MTVFVGSDTARTRRTLDVGGRSYAYYSIEAAEAAGLGDFSRLPAALKVVLENMLRFEDDRSVTLDDIRAFSEWAAAGGQQPPRDRLPSRPRPHAGLHRRPGRGRPRRDARRDQGARRRPAEDQPLEPRRPRHRPFGDGRRVRHPARLPAQRRPRVRAQHRALPVPQVGAERLRQLPGGAAGHRHLPPGQPRVPRPDRVDRQGPLGRARRLSRHPRRHRQPHDDGQRHGRARLGRRRHRGRGGDARPAGVDADPRGRRLQAHRQDGRGHDRDRPRAQGRADAAPEGRGRQVRRVLRRRPRPPAARRPRDDRQHGARVRRHLRLLPDRRRDPALPAPDRPRRGADRAGRGLCQGQRHVARGGLRAGLHRHAAPRHGRDRPGDRRPEAAAGLHAARPGGTRLLQDRRRLSRHRRLANGATRWWTRAVASSRRRSRRAPDRGGRGRGLHHPRRLGGDRRDHLLHQHLEPLRDDRRRPRGAQGAGAGAEPQAVGEDLAGAGQRRSSRSTSRPPACRRISTPSASTSPATAAPPASATRGRSGFRRSPRRSPTTTSWRPRCCRATATSRAASRPTCGRTIWRARRSSSPTRSPATSTST